MAPFLALLVSLLLLTGCAARRNPAGTWKLEPAGRGHILTPPRADAGKPEFTVKKARLGRLKAPGCVVDHPRIALRWRGRDAKVRADAASLAPLPGTLAAATRPDGSAVALTAQMAVTTNWFEEVLRPALQKQVGEGCLAAAELPWLDRRLIDNLRLPSGALYRLRFGEFTLNGYLDVNAEFRLRAVEPIREGGVVTGYLTSFYMLSPAPNGGVLVTAGGAESNVQAKLIARPAADSELLHLPADATFLRLFFRTWSSTQDRRIALIAAPTAAERERASKEFEADPESYCARVAKQRGVACVSVPKDMVVGPELRVTANGKDAFAPVGGTLNDILRGAGLRDGREAPATLQVWRPYEGKLVRIEFDRMRMEILGLVLIGGERITW